MKIRHLFFAMMAAASVLVSCEEKEENLGAPEITLDPATLEFGETGGADNAQTLTVTSTRDWTIEQDEKYDWVTVSPSEGQASSEPQTVTVTVTDNTQSDRTATIRFTATNGTVYKDLTVRQTGPEGSVEETYVYFNDFDKEAAQKGDNGWDTYLDTFDGWRNEIGTGINSVTYESSGASARTLSMDSASGMSLYEGSGVNNVFFGKNAYFQIGNLTLDPETLNYTLSFGTERYGQSDPDNTFNHDEFQVYISNDGSKWVEIEYTFAQGSDPVGKWDLASSSFTVPSGTSELYIYFNVLAASVYRIDDLKLATSSEAGVNIDFSQGGEIENGDSPIEPSEIKDVTVAEFLAAPVSTDVWYRLKGTVGGPINTQYGNFDIIDETGKVYVYGTSNFSEFTVNEGDNITIVGQRGKFGDKDEVLEAYIEEVIPGEPVEPTEPIEVTIAEFLEVPVSSTQYYILTGEITDLYNTEYGNFTLVDETGSVKVYGLTEEKVSSNDKSFSSLGLKEGDIVTICGTRDEYNGDAQVGGPAYYISHEAGEEPEPDPDSPFTSNVTWTLGESSYSETATINGQGPVDVLKLGTSKKTGFAYITIPAGTTSVEFYAVAWNNTTETLSFEIEGTQFGTQEVQGNEGAANNQPYTITVTDDDHYVVNSPMPAPTEMEVKVTTAEQGRVILWGIKAITE